MRKNVVVTWLPLNRKTTIEQRATVLRAAQKGRVIIPSRCAGVASCLLCKVCIVQPEAVNEVTDIERRTLGPMISEGIRLACQVRIERDTTIVLRASPLQEAVRRLREQQTDS